MIYLTMGLLYLCNLIYSKNNDKEYNVIGSVVVITIWPLILVNNIIKKMKILEFLKKPFGSKKNTSINEDQESLGKIILDLKNKQNQELKKEVKPKLLTYEIDNHTFKVGDKVICRTNEPYPLLVGKIVEFWNNNGKWEKAVPVIRNISNGKKFNAHGVIKPYSEELLNTLKPMKALEQWNYLVPEEVRYTEEEIKKKEESFKKREKFLPNKK